MKRLIFSFFFTCLSLYYVSALAQNLTSVSVDSFNIKGGVKGADHWYGFKDSLIITKLTIVPQYINIEAPTLDNDQTEFHVFDSCVVYRKYKEEEAQKVGVFLGTYIKNDAILFIDSVEAVLGENDKISYDIKLFYKKYTRELNDQEWKETDLFSEDVEINTWSFSVFEEPKIVEENFSIPNLNTYVGGPTRSFSFVYDSIQYGYEKGWKIEWFLDDKSVSGLKEYTFDPIDAVFGDKTLSARILNLAPDGKTVLYVSEWSWKINIYMNPEVAVPIQKGPETKYACVEVHKNQEYESSVEILDANNYGSWKYEWYLKDKLLGKSSTIKYGFPNEEGMYDLNLILTTYNPGDDKEEWYKDTITLETITIFSEPIVEKIGLNNFVYKHGDEIKLQINVSGGCEGGWNYKWYKKNSLSGKDVELSSDKKISFTCENKGTKLMEESIYCVVTNYVEDTENGTIETLYSETKTLQSLIEIYPAPVFVPQNIHHNEDAEEGLYSLYVGQELDPEILKGILGGSGGYPNGWKYELFVDGKLNEKFKPNNVGSYELEYKVSNTAIQTDKSQVTWFEEIFKFTFEVLKDPHVVDYLFYSENGNNLENFDGTEELHVVKGTDIQVQLEGIGGCQDSWQADWTLYRGKKQVGITDTEKDNNRFIMKFKTEENLTKDSIHYLIKYKIYNNPPNHVKTGMGENAPFVTEGEKQIVIWRDINTQAPGLKISENNIIYIETYDNENISLTIDNVGGAASRWENTWIPQEESPIGMESSNGEKYELSNLMSYNGKPSTYSYKVESKYGAHSDTYNFVVVVWPKPILKDVMLKLNKKGTDISYNIDKNKITPQCYTNDLFLLEYTIEGGIMSENRNVWKCIVTDKNGNVSHEIKDTSGKFSLKAADLSVKFIHEYDNLYNSTKVDWLSNSNEYVIEPDIYDQPKIDEFFTDSSTIAKWGEQIIDVYEGQPINMKYVLKKGYDDGWKLSWKADKNVNEETESQWTYTPQLESGTNPYEEKTIVVSIENSIADNVGLYEVKEYPIRVWRKANFKDPKIKDKNNFLNEISDETFNVRVGNELELNVDPIEFGYIDYNSYKYTWDINGVTQNGSNVTSLMEMKDNSPEFSSEFLTIKFNAQVIGPYGKVWDSYEKTYNVDVYNKPKTPTKLYKKGNGTSGTLICETELTDEELAEYKYYLVYGYVNAYGQDVDFASIEQKNPGTVRWSLTPSNDVLKNDLLYVYALWKDGTIEITSGKKYISREDIDDDWDGSTYNGSIRAVLNNNHTKIEDISSKLLEGVEIVQIYSMDGIAIGKNVKELSRGMYIINYMMPNENKMKSRKIVIK